MAAELSAGTAYIDILPNLRGFARDLARGLTGPQRAFQYAGRSLTHHVTLPIVAAGVAAVKMGVDFDTSLEKIAGLTGHTRKEVAGMGKAILDLAPQVQKGPKELADALYFIESSGVHGALALQVLKASAKGATSGLGETQTVADAVTSAMNAYGHSNLSAAKAVDILSATVKDGKGEATAFAPALGALLPLSQRLGVSFDQVGAAIASMTLIGETVPRAATALRGLYTSLLNQSPGVKKALKAVGLTLVGLQTDLANPRKGLPFVLVELEKAFDGNIQAIRKAFPNIRGLSGLLDLTGKNLRPTEAIFRRMAHTTGQNDRAFKAIAEGSGKQIRDLLVHLQVDAIKLGHILLPVVDQIIRKFSGWLTAFEGLEPHEQKMIGFGVLALAVLGPLLSVIGNLILVVRLLAISVQFLAGSLETLYLVILYNPELTALLTTLVLIGAAMVLFRGHTDEAKRAMQDLTDATNEYLIAAGKVTRTAEDLKDARLRFREAKLAVSDANASLNRTLKDDTATKSDIRHARLQLAEAKRELERARKAQNDAKQANHDAQRSDVATGKIQLQKLFALRQKLDLLARSGKGPHRFGIGEFLGSVDFKRVKQFAASVAQTTIALTGSKKAADLAKKNVLDFIVAQRRIPTKKELTVLIHSAKAKADLEELHSQLLNLTRAPHLIDVIIRTHGSINAPTGLKEGTSASGHEFWRGGWTWVGESGKELVNLPRGSKILPHGESLKATGDNGDIYVLTITNWETGEGRMRRIAADEVQERSALGVQKARMRR